MFFISLGLFPTAISLILILISYAVLRCFYNLYIHPLRSYPGPLLARASVVVYQQQILKGLSHLWLQELHNKYGPVVRIAPNELSFIKPEVWKDAYGHRASGFIKTPDYYGPDPYGHPPGIMRADNVSHAKQRKTVSHAFSDKALRDQEELLRGYVWLLVEKLRDMANGGLQFDIVEWYNFATFDIMADLTFGESLNQLTDSSYHPWVKAVFSYSKNMSISRLSRAWPLLNRLLRLMIPKTTMIQREQHLKFSAESIDKRMSRKTDRPDFWTFVTRGGEEGLKPTELYSNGMLFMLAGTETTATELSGLTYLLLKNPDKAERLSKELRAAFSSFDDINMSNLSHLPYLNACIEEGLRYYPPVPIGPPRTTPSSGAYVCGKWIPGGTVVQCAIYTAQHSPLNFKAPDQFLPERFLPEGKEEFGSDRQDALNPFSSGPRNCIGKNLAYHEMRLLLASVFFHFNLELCDTTSDWLHQETHVIWDKNPLMIKLKAQAP